MAAKWKKQEFNLQHSTQAEPIPIIHDALIASSMIGSGQFIPLLIIDIAARPDLSLVVQAHQRLHPGDVRLQWGSRERGKATVALYLWFERPVETFAFFEFTIVTHWSVVDAILTARAFYLQPGVAGDRLVGNEDAPRILVGAPELGFRPEWEKILRRAVAADLQRRGLSRREAKRATEATITEWRKLARFRMVGRSSEDAAGEEGQ